MLTDRHRDRVGKREKAVIFSLEVCQEGHRRGLQRFSVMQSSFTIMIQRSMRRRENNLLINVKNSTVFLDVYTTTRTRNMLLNAWDVSP